MTMTHKEYIERITANVTGTRTTQIHRLEICGWFIELELTPSKMTRSARLLCKALRLI